MGNYDDIINADRPETTKKPMSREERAAQFAPFAALDGYGASVSEAARLTDKEFGFHEDELDRLNLKLMHLKNIIDEHPRVAVTYFEEDEHKEGGRYVSVEGTLYKLDPTAGFLMLKDVTPNIVPSSSTGDALDMIAIEDHDRLAITIHSLYDISIIPVEHTHNNL